jgi:hypothetical protein
MAKNISSGRLTPNATYLVRGKVGYSHIATHTTDAERMEANKRRQHPIDKNYTTLTIHSAQVLCKDPANPTIEEQYAAESLYNSSSPKYPGKNFSGMNKSRNLPQVGVLTPTPEAPNNYVETKLDAELASGLDVTLVMRVYKGQGSNNGVSLDRVLVNEPIRYYGGNSEVDKTLSDFGITFQAMAPAAKNADAEPVNNGTETAPATAPAQTAAPVDTSAFASVNSQPVAQPQNAAPAANDTAPATDNPFSSYGAAPNNMQFGPGTRQY